MAARPAATAGRTYRRPLPHSTRPGAPPATSWTYASYSTSTGWPGRAVPSGPGNREAPTMLARLRIGQKLNLLLVLPLIAVVITTVPIVVERIDAARASVATARAAGEAR